MDFKELPFPLQVQTDVPRAVLCLLSGYFYFPLVPVTASKDGREAEEGVSANPLGGTGICLGTCHGQGRDSSPGREAVWEAWQLKCLQDS